MEEEEFKIGEIVIRCGSFRYWEKKTIKRISKRGDIDIGEGYDYYKNGLRKGGGWNSSVHKFDQKKWDEYINKFK